LINSLTEEIRSLIQFASSRALVKHGLRRNKKIAYHYTKGELNRAINSLIHPLSKRNPTLVVLDVILHGLVEQKTSETVVKFIRYSLPQIIAEMSKNKEH
jgi:hypothetical protein